MGHGDKRGYVQQSIESNRDSSFASLTQIDDNLPCNISVEKIKHKHQRLLLLLHASKCQHKEGTCPEVAYCSILKELWKHMMECKDIKSSTEHCLESQQILAHYRKRQRLLMLLRASKCQNKEETCPEVACCSIMKRRSNECNDDYCLTQHCFQSRNTIARSRARKEADRQGCVPIVREKKRKCSSPVQHRVKGLSELQPPLKRTNYVNNVEADCINGIIEI